MVEAVGVALSERYALGGRSKGLEPRTPVTQQRGLTARMKRIMEKFGGSRRDAARASGVPYSTWNHLLAGRRVSSRNLEKITGAFQRLVTAPSRALRVKRVGLPDVWSIGAVVVNSPSSSRYVNGRGEVPKDQVAAVAAETSGPEWRYFNAEGLDSARIVDAWLTQGDGAATDALVAEIEDVYGSEFGFWGDAVDVAFHHREG